MIVLDTHVFIWYLLNNPKLSSEARELLAENPESVFVPAICFWEAIMLCQKGSMSFGGEPPERTLRKQLKLVGFKEAPLTAEIAMLSRTLDFEHDDPADRFIAATAYALKAKLATSDQHLRTLPWVKLAY